jgi:hypothetical protein
MSEWNAYRQYEARATLEQHARLQAMFYALVAGGRINTAQSTEESGPIRVWPARAAEAEYRGVIRTAGMVKVEWDDEFCIEWQAWLAADGEIVKVFSFHEDQLEDGIDGDWYEQSGICAALNTAKVGA